MGGYESEEKKKIFIVGLLLIPSSMSSCCFDVKRPLRDIFIGFWGNFEIFFANF